VAPLLAFLVLLDGGYLVLFTIACGQTLGKMIMRIRVVGVSTDAVIGDRVTIGQAVARSVAAVVSLVPFGLGYWMALGPARRTLHDRIAHTRVVRA
jgi:uncharacterized RDD family membrane protein YckC